MQYAKNAMTLLFFLNANSKEPRAIEGLAIQVKKLLIQ